jgi:hypothetical protein
MTLRSVSSAYCICKRCQHISITMNVRRWKRNGQLFMDGEEPIGVIDHSGSDAHLSLTAVGWARIVSRACATLIVRFELCRNAEDVTRASIVDTRDEITNVESETWGT